jgi:DNA-binding NtrC family response regulator
VDDEENARDFIGQFLSSKGYEVVGVGTLAEARECIQKEVGDVVLLDVQLPDGYGPNLLVETATMHNAPPIIMITAFGDIDMAVESMKNGAHDFLTKPVQMPVLEKSIKRAFETVQMRRELSMYRQSQRNKSEFVIGQSPQMKMVLNMAERSTQKDISVLISGETGTGKEVLANYIYQISPRSTKQFVPINCAAVQSTMLESEFFGYEAGAFTGADKRKHGLVEIADGGILFLDEISSMPLDLQAKLLRMLDDHKFRRVGGTTLSQVDVQVLAASNRDLKTLIKNGQFREDLYYRLTTIELTMPTLRERKEDIPELVGFFIRKRNPDMGLNIQGVTPRALDALIKYDWPGNIRELRNAIERAMLLCDEAVIDLAHLSRDITSLQ